MQLKAMKSRRKNINSNYFPAKLQKASRLFEAGKLKDAKRIYSDVLKHAPKNSELLQMLGLIENELGNYDSVERYFRRAINADPNRLSLYIHIGQFYIAQNKPEDALQFLKEAINIDNYSPELLCLFGDANKQLKFKNEAISWYLKSINHHPEFILAYVKLGNCYQAMNMLDKAFKCYQKVLSVLPNDFMALHNIGNIYQKMGSLDDAIDCYQKALAQTPDYAEIYDSLGNAFQRKRNFESAYEAYQKALSIAPDCYTIIYNIGKNLIEQSKILESKQWLEKALEINPDFQPANIYYFLSLPIIYSSQEEIDFYRMEFSKGIDTLINAWNDKKENNHQLYLNGLNEWTNFYLPYQGKNDLLLQKKIGGYISSIMKANFPNKSLKISKPSLKGRGKIRVGYVSEFMYSHTVGKLFIGWIEKANTSAFEIYCYHTNPLTDQVTERYKTSCFKFRHILKEIDHIADQIISDGIDVLVYLDIGMNSRTLLLSALRLAPVQCVTWGHPVTTGLPSIDYFLSSELMEPADSQVHYSEVLIKLPNLSISYIKPILPKTINIRKEFGLRDEDFVYLASQSLFKYLPEDDYIYVQIALLVPESKFVFIEHESKNVTNLFKRRLELEFQKEHLASEAFCIFQPRLSYNEFLSLNLVSDVLLDPPAWSGGMTSLEGVSCGLPTVTLPGNLMRSRHTYAILKFAGIHETIAKNRADYIQIAAKLGTDADFYATCNKSITDKIDRIYEDQQSINGLESFYKSVVNIPGCISS